MWLNMTVELLVCTVTGHACAGEAVRLGVEDASAVRRRESHYLWGRLYLLSIVERDTKPAVHLSHRWITLSVRFCSGTEKRKEVMHEWHKALLHEVVPPLIRSGSRSSADGSRATSSTG